MNISGSTRQLIRKEIRETAYHYSEEMHADMERMYGSAMTLRSTFEKYSLIQREDRRDYFIEITRQLLESNPEFYSVWTVWEPNALDGMDNEYRNKPGCNSKGRFGATWYWYGNKLAINDTSEEEALDPTDYYQEVKRQKKTFLDDPCWYDYSDDGKNRIFNASLVLPIIVNGRFVGSLGIDLLLSRFQNQIQNLSPYPGSKSFLISHGLMIAAAQNTNRIGTSALDLFPKDSKIREKITSAISEGKTIDFIAVNPESGKKELFFFSPVGIGNTDTHWSLLMTVPVSVFYLNARNSYTLLTILILLLLITVSVTVLFMAKKIAQPILNVSEVMQDVVEGEGDLTRRIETSSQDEIGNLANHFNALLARLNHDLSKVDQSAQNLKDGSTSARQRMEEGSEHLTLITRSIGNIARQTENAASGIEQLTATVEEMARNIDSLMNSMSRQAASVEESASSIEEMARNIEQTAGMAEKTKDISKNLNQVAQEGSSAVNNSMTSIREVSEYSRQILKLLSLITNIAKQTNLLAMNAAIEAAHAGEAGKGFAIVADEIRRLSEDTNKNARDIGEVVGTIVSKIDESVKLSEKAGIGLEMITAYSQQNVKVISQLSLALSEQKNGAQEILKSTEDLVRITEEVKLSMTEQKKATDEFSHALADLRDEVIQNKDHLIEHSSSTAQLQGLIEEIRDQGLKNQENAEQLGHLVSRFKLDRNAEDEPTGLALKSDEA